jgi:hypothetical protein
MTRYRYSFAGRTPSPGSVAITNGRRYSDSSPPAGGTHCSSTAISLRSDSRNNSSGSSGIASRRAEDRRRAALASGRNDTTEPSAQR